MAGFGYLLPTRGVVLGSDDRSTLAAKTQADIIGLARRAESMGFSSVWVGDSILAKPRLHSLATLSAVGTATDGVDLGTAVHLPPLRHPVTVAHQTATLDQLSGGRLRFGIGVGIGDDVEAEYDNLDLSYGRRGRRLDEALEVITELWSGEPVDFDGEFFSLDGASIGFGPAVDPPIYIPTAAFDPAQGFPAPFRRRLVEHGGGWLPIGLDPPQYAAGLDRVTTILEDNGRDPATFDAAYYIDVVIDDSAEAAIEEARRFHDQYYPARDPEPDEWYHHRGAFGPKADVIEELEAYADAGVEQFVVRFPAADQRAQLRQFASIVK